MSTPGMTPPGMPTQGGDNPIASLLQQLSQRQQQLPNVGTGGQGQSGGTNVAPLLQTMSPAQAGGPAAQPRGPRPDTSSNGGGTGSSKTFSAIAAGMQGLGAGVREAKQRKFEQEASMAAVFTAASIAEEKQKAKMPLTAQELQSIKMADKLAKKKEKIMEKAMTDPMSGAYVGTQRAHQAINQAAIEAEQRKEQLAKMMADVAYRQQMGNLAAAKPGMAKDKLESQEAIAANKLTAEQTIANNKLVATNSLKGINTTFDENNKAIETPYTKEQIDANPM